MITRLQTRGSDPNYIPALNSNQEFKEAPQRAEKTHDTTVQLLVAILNEQSEKDPQRVARARITRAKLSEPVSVPVEEHTTLFQASNNNQLGF